MCFSHVEKINWLRKHISALFEHSCTSLYSTISCEALSRINPIRETFSNSFNEPREYSLVNKFKCIHSKTHIPLVKNRILTLP